MFHLLQEWEGRVVEIGDENFTAMLVDLTAGHSHESAEAVIPFAEVSECHAADIAVGRIFRWVVGCERSADGAGKPVLRVVFRDPIEMTESDIIAGRVWAEKIASAFNTEIEEQAP